MLVNSNWWATIRNLDLDAAKRGELLKDLVDDVDFANSLKAVTPLSKQEGMVRAWEALPPNLRTLISNLEPVSRFLAIRNVDPTILRNEISSLGNFQNDFIKSLDNAIGSAPYPRITNKEEVDIDGTLLGRFENGVFIRDPSSNAQLAGSWDYIVKLDGEIVVGRKHSWLSNGGEDVLAAGEIKWNNGVIVDINNSSGHYQPTPGEGFNFLRLFNEQGVDISNAWLTLRVEIPPYSYPVFKQVSPNGVIRFLYE